ncbi:Proline racemase family like protein [Aduncisulcus paluster]|uniref:Proline racemase family like protein n=1 Tax=Aduncisulcus paluster TaxID=2918883 RepID=A0ABQ5KWP9_9EUKA|nr:Proline racemase family like protein [Aduncisulcus paluster]
MMEIAKLDPHEMISSVKSQYDNVAISIESHTAGESTSLYIGGIGALEGETVREKCDYLYKHYKERILHLGSREPRGRGEMVNTLLIPPVSKTSLFSIIYFTIDGFLQLCGHGTIGTIECLIKTGTIKPDGRKDIPIPLDTASGQIIPVAHMSDDGEVESVSVTMVPAFVYKQASVSVESIGTFDVHIVNIGTFFVMVEAEIVGLDLDNATKSELVAKGLAIRKAINEQIEISHPAHPGVNRVDMTQFYSTYKDDRLKGRSAIVYGVDRLDSSPCGSGTSAKMALLHYKGELKIGEVYTNYGPAGVPFKAKVVRETKLGDQMAVIPEITGKAYVVGIRHHLLDPSDPFQDGVQL